MGIRLTFQILSLSLSDCSLLGPELFTLSLGLELQLQADLLFPGIIEYFCDVVRAIAGLGVVLRPVWRRRSLRAATSILIC